MTIPNRAIPAKLIKVFIILYCCLIGINNNIAQQREKEIGGWRSSKDIASVLGVGINLGNTLDAIPTEGDWAPKAKEKYFLAFKQAGFRHVRIPITWHDHVSLRPPYKVSKKWMARVKQVTQWALDQKLIVTINAHHEKWLKQIYSNKNIQARFLAIWEQVAQEFKDKPDSLLFEILNEPFGMTTEEVDHLNEKAIIIIRKTNPYRTIIYSGASWTSFGDLEKAKVPSDNYLIANFHLYTPWKFAGLCIESWGSKSDLVSLESIYEKASVWSKLNQIPIMINEFGVAKYDHKQPSNKCAQRERLLSLTAHVKFATERNIGITIWDDNGSFGVYDRDQDTWGEERAVLIK